MQMWREIFQTKISPSGSVSEEIMPLIEATEFAL